jgi:dTDP-4-dehydrorhamnose reductase
MECHKVVTDRILVTGSAGQLGRDLTDHLSGRPGIEAVGADHAGLDVTNRAAVLTAVEQIGPRWIVHAAAWTAVDPCESDPDRAFAVNAYGVRNVAEAARRSGAHLAVISTDYVFDGTLDRPYDEWDRTNPLSVYGRSKLGGEHEAGPGATIIRTSWLFGAHGPNMIRTVVRLARKAATGGAPLRFVEDQRGCPTGCDDLAPMVADLTLNRCPGVFHATNAGPTSWYGLARDVVAAAGFDPELIEPITTADLDPPRPAPRPANSVLDNRALRVLGASALPDWHEPMERLVKLLAEEEL